MAGITLAQAQDQLGVRPENFKVPVPTDDSSYIGRCRFVRADGGPYWPSPLRATAER